MWGDGWDDQTVLLLEDEAGQTITTNFFTDWPGPWNSSERNPFLDDDWKPLRDPLLEGERRWDHVMDTGYLLNTPIDISPVSKQQTSLDFFEVRKEPRVEPSQGPDPVKPCSSW